MFFVYLLTSITYPTQKYIGRTKDIQQRLKIHNSGKSPYTSAYRPWRLVTYMAFSSEKQAIEFEQYLKSGSGHAFALNRLWPSFSK